ncbi:MAG: response regulator [Sandaracinaceae bacterium]
MTHLLIVDDNEDNRNMLSRRLRRRGFDADVAEDGPTALAMLEGDTRYDVVLLDVMMPGMSGLEVLDRVRQRWSSLQLPVIMATARTESEDVVEALTKGANDYVTKPIDFPVLLARLAAAVTMREAHLASAAPPDTSTLDAIGPGTVLHGRYELVGAIGQGGFAVVYEARQTSTGQRVAVKMLHEDLVDEVQLKRFEREMQIIAALRHPHVVRLIDYGHVRSTASVMAPPVQRDGATRGALPANHQPEHEADAFPVPYLVMELLEGKTLQTHLSDEGAYDARSAVDLMLPVVSAVATAHEHRVVHRDLKPANIFLARGVGAAVRPIVLDFGIAKPGGMVELTMPSAFVGTPHYMAPEQALGADQVDERADQYSLAMLLFEALLGHSPFKGRAFFQVIHAVAHGNIPKPSELEGVSVGLCAVMETALSLDPASRYGSASELGQALLPYASEGVRASWADAFDAAKGASTDLHALDGE